MLKSLYIHNYALISELDIDFESGFSSITGETGAGKSIILGALSLILGQRADTKAIKPDSEKCVIEAIFDISKYVRLKHFFAENDIDLADTECIIRRELTSVGKSRAFINDTPVSLNILRDLTVQLIDIHSQHDNLLLSNPNYQLDVVDCVAQNQLIRNKYTEKYSEWNSLKNELKLLEKNAQKYGSELDYIRFQYNQLAESNLKIGELEELENEHETLVHADEIKSELSHSQALLDNESAILPLLKDLVHSLSKLKPFLTVANEWSERLQSNYIDIKDICSEIQIMSDRVEINPQRLEQVDNRLSELFLLQKKYKVQTTDELIEIRDNFELQLQKIESFDEDLEFLKTKINDVNTELSTIAAELTQSRQNICSNIENFLINRLTELGMPNIQFKIQINESEDFSTTGKDEVQFLFSANKNRELFPVHSIASGGEISRLMLSIKALIADKSELPTIIFDEIDTGVSGEIAQRMGVIMQEMSHSMQVLAITHLPQIAAKAKVQYRVFKDESGVQTHTYIEKLSTELRINEIAQMLSGKNISEAAILNAKELLSLH